MMSASGVMWAGPLLDRGGYGNVSRNYVRSLLAGSVPVRTYNLGHEHRDVDQESLELMKACSNRGVGNAPIGVVHYEPTVFPRLRVRGVSAVVLSSIFETNSIPPKWVELCRQFEQVWVPSRFNESTYSDAGVPREKIRVIPIPADCEYFRPGHPRVPIPGASGFVYLYVFSFGWRKGFDLLLRAYLEEFTRGEDVTLVLKVYKGNPDIADLRTAVLSSVKPDLDPEAPGLPRVLVQTDPVPQDQLRALYASCDLYVSTDRANGWGMPCMEAMAMGKAAATIDWSGSTEFMTSRNSFLIRPDSVLEPVDSRLVAARPDLYSGQMWPRVDVREIRRVLRLAYEDRRQLREKGECAAQEIRERFSFQRVGAIFREVLESFTGHAAPSESGASIRYSWGTRLRVAASRLRERLSPRR